MTAPRAKRWLSHSEWSSYMDCRAAWFCKYPLRQRSERSHPSRRLGSLFEVAFAAKLRGWAMIGFGACLGRQRYVIDPSKPRTEWQYEEGPPETDPLEAIRRKCAEETWPGHDDRYGSTEEAAELALALVPRAFELLGFAAGRFRPVLIDGCAAIQPHLEAPLPFPEGSDAAAAYRGLRGVPDLVVLDGERDWRPVLGDTKVRGSLSPVDLGADNQLALYQYLLRAKGVRVYLCEQWGLLDKVPLPPPLTEKTRKVSRAEEHPTTPELYRAACRANGEKPSAEHEEKLSRRAWHLAAAGGATDAEVDQVVRELVADAEVMAALELRAEDEWPSGRPLARNNRTWAGAPCQRCDLRDQCHSTKSQGLPVHAALVPRPAAIEADTLEDLEREEG